MLYAETRQFITKAAFLLEFNLIKIHKFAQLCTHFRLQCNKSITALI